MSSFQSNCTFLIHYDIENAPQPHEIMKALQSPNVKKVIQALKTLILCIINNPAYPRMMMHVFNYVIPKQKESHVIKKVLLYYWEVGR